MEGRMNRYSGNCPLSRAILITVILGTIMLGSAAAVLGHGGKSHGGTGFSALQAVQKATGMYDRLITSGKLPEEWETGLERIIISDRQSGDQREYVVQFQRQAGKPNSVYFFFDQKGEYSGSNFSGE